MKTLQGLLRYLSAEQLMPFTSSFVRSASDQFLNIIVGLTCSNLGPSLQCSYNQRVSSGCFMCKPFESHIKSQGASVCFAPLLSDTDVDVGRGLVACINVLGIAQGKGERETRGGSWCMGNPATGDDICMELISHASLMQKPFNCFQPSSTL